MKYNDFLDKDIAEIDDIYLQSLWYITHGQWDIAHEIVQRQKSILAYWIHGLLHREEGDMSNSNYWYTKAKRKLSTKDIEDECIEIFNYIKKQ